MKAWICVCVFYLLLRLHQGFPCGSAGKESSCNAGDLGSIPGLGRSPEEGKGYPFQYSGLENSMDCIVHGVTKSRTQLSDFHFHLRDVLCVRFKLIPSSDRDGFQQQYWAVSSGRTVQMCLSDAGMLGAQQEKS